MNQKLWNHVNLHTNEPPGTQRSYEPNEAQKSEIGGHQFSTIKTYQTGPPEAIFWLDATRDSFEELKMLSNEARSYGIM